MTYSIALRPFASFEDLFRGVRSVLYVRIRLFISFLKARGSIVYYSMLNSIEKLYDRELAIAY